MTSLWCHDESPFPTITGAPSSTYCMGCHNPGSDIMLTHRYQQTRWHGNRFCWCDWLTDGWTEGQTRSACVYSKQPPSVTIIPPQNVSALHVSWKLFGLSTSNVGHCGPERAPGTKYLSIMQIREYGTTAPIRIPYTRSSYMGVKGTRTPRYR